MKNDRLRVAVLGAGKWAEFAHIPGWQRDPRSEVAVLCDLVGERARETARQFSIPEATDDWQAVVGRPDIDVVNIATPSRTHHELALAAIEAGKHVLCEKPVAYDFHETRRAAERAKNKGLKTKLGFTFRYSPGVQPAKAMIDEGFVGTPFIMNGYEQNSQWLDPLEPLRQVDHDADPSILQTSSLEGYGAPIIDISHWWVGADLSRVVGTMRNFIPERMVRDTGRMMRMNIDDGDIYLCEFTNGAIGSIQTSFVTIGNYPGVEARIYGSTGAIICRLVEEFGVAESIKVATSDDVEFKELEIPKRFYPVGGHPRESWRSLFYANLIRDFIDEIVEGGERNQGNFVDGAWVQEVINAVELSFHERRWVDLSTGVMIMETKAPAFTKWLDDFFDSYCRHRPVNATFIGVHDYDDRLPDFSEGGVAEVVGDMKSLLRRLHGLPEEPLTEFEAIDRKLAEGFLEIQLWEFESHHFQRGNPSLHTGEAIFGVMSLFLRPFAPLPDRVESAIARLAAMPGFLAQARKNVRRAPEAWTQRAIRECTGALHFLGEGVNILMEDEQLSESRLRERADQAAEAFTELQNYFESELLQNSVDDYDCGEKPLDLLIKKGHFLDMDAAAIEKFALERLSECEEALESKASSFGAKGWKETLPQLLDAHPTVEHYYGRYQEIWDACRATVEQQKLLTWPDYPIRYVPQPRWARKAAPYLYFLFYRSPAPFDEVPILDYLVTPIEPEMAPEEQERLLRTNNDSVIKLNHVVHHGGPGHHVQNYYAFRSPSRIGQVAAVDCASRIAMFCGGTMAEGWACYATDLMEEVGFLNPLEQLAEAHSRLRMAGRALVNTRLHSREFTLEQAAEFYEDRVGVSPQAAHAETVKNSMFPGTALMYLMGTEVIHQLRRGHDGSNRHFHDHLLIHGTGPGLVVGSTTSLLG